ncbi:MAG: DUF2218 domain-containing protein [Sphingobium sp.]|nr:DUF2218 domain-containing protein [Sphingobium sp.]
MTLTVLGCMARIPTVHAARYLQQLCAHWKQRFRVELGEARGVVQIPKDARDAGWPADGLIVLIAGVVDLEVRIEASCVDQLEAMQSAVVRHLARFTLREAPLAIEWR